MVLTSKVLRLLEKMLDGSMERVQPKIQAGGKFSYPEAEEVLDAHPGGAREILDSLAHDDILREEFFDKILTCPECRSHNLKFSLNCPECRSPNTSKREVLEHLSCGNTRPREEFELEGSLVCPKCGEELEAIGVDYSRVGELYLCGECGEQFDEPRQEWRCADCSASFPPTGAEEMNLYTYTLNEEKREWVRIQLGPKREVEKILRERGFEVQPNPTIAGKSGVKHSVDVYAADGDWGGKIVVSVCEKPDLRDIIDLHAIAEDVGTRAVLVASEPPEKKVKKFADKLSVNILREEDLEESNHD
ncbi:hypothetical protein AKJ47_02475 [candidate division MSBL1 archaeon SCGC-AAA261G05]|uniref:Thaumarchaeal output domain-containing protein n=2 Tax=candidate division MSBL1 TaxID=215777 RepID=A0A133UY34_9EURY|nr:hypothetical protein AKJ42_03745 [candidate division MSBL1 archaeon SCGC-AAA261C02]KXB03305.1 hypothetical protein AKJ47_02475 [candidate division MSBL1 archaeon SCGC-AAA261G05]